MIQCPEGFTLGMLDPLKHDRASFQCSDPDLTAYIRQYARQDNGKDMGKTHILVVCDSTTIAAFCTLASAGIQRSEAIGAAVNRQGQIPAMIIGRLGVDHRFASKGLGGFMLLHAVHEIVDIAEHAAVAFIVVDAKNVGVKSFYQKYGFCPVPENPMRLVMPIGTARRLLSG